MKKKKPLPTIWEVPDEVWECMEPLILEMDPAKETGRARVDPRHVVDALISSPAPQEHRNTQCCKP